MNDKPKTMTNPKDDPANWSDERILAEMLQSVHGFGLALIKKSEEVHPHRSRLVELAYESFCSVLQATRIAASSLLPDGEIKDREYAALGLTQ